MTLLDVRLGTRTGGFCRLLGKAMAVSFILAAAEAAPAEPAGLSALGAVKLLPKGAAGRVAVIAGEEGKPVPARWHILVYDAKEEDGLHEYVVANGEVVASRSISQFAEELKGEDVVGAEFIKFDSDKAGKVAQRYAAANQAPVETYNYELKKAGRDAAPIWHVTCVDPKGDQIGEVVLTATKGTVLSHDGFRADPTGAPGVEAEKPKTAESEEKKKDKKPQAKPAASPAPKPSPTPKPVAERSEPIQKPEPIAAATPLPVTATPRPGRLKRVENGIRNLFGGGNRD